MLSRRNTNRLRKCGNRQTLDDLIASAELFMSSYFMPCSMYTLTMIHQSYTTIVPIAPRSPKYPICSSPLQVVCQNPPGPAPVPAVSRIHKMSETCPTTVIATGHGNLLARSSGLYHFAA